MRFSQYMTLLCCLVLLSLASADDTTNSEKRSKLPPLIPVGFVEGEIVYVEHGADRLSLKVKEITQEWVAGNSGGAPGILGRSNRVNRGGSYVPKVELKDKPVNLSPDLKVRLMYAPPVTDNKDKKKVKPPTEKERAEKDPEYKLGGYPGKKSQLAKGQMVRIALGRNNDRVNPQIYGMVVYVIKDSK